MKQTIKETDLYPPLQRHFTNLGFTVRSEVKDCDLVALKDDALVIVELKTSINTSLLVQATSRLCATEWVYVAVPKPRKGIHTNHWKGIYYVLKKLELGLIFVSFATKVPFVEVVFDPAPFTERRRKSTRDAIVKESLARSGDYNSGGSTRTKIVTSYREYAIMIACCLREYGPLSAVQLRKLGCDTKSSQILQSNVYDWFTRLKRGTYDLTDKGRSELHDYPLVEEHCMNVIRTTTQERV